VETAYQKLNRFSKVMQRLQKKHPHIVFVKKSRKGLKIGIPTPSKDVSTPSVKEK